jgi:hypothetical protein
MNEAHNDYEKAKKIDALTSLVLRVLRSSTRSVSSSLDLINVSYALDSLRRA